MKIAYPQSETHQAKHDFLNNFKSFIGQHQSLEFVGLGHMLSDVILEILHAVESQNEPQLQGSESSAKRNLPVLKNSFLSNDRDRILNDLVKTRFLLIHLKFF